MDCYKSFAAVYDLFMVKDIPYDAWAGYIADILREGDVRGEPVLDLGCGTGNMTLRLAQRGYDMIGVDVSEDMLALAQDKAFAAGHRVLWLAQDMRVLDLYGTVGAVVCTCDCMNYVLEPGELGEVFRRVRLFLSPGGVFIFDMNTEYKFKEMGSGAFGDKMGGAEYAWDNFFDAHTKINEYRLRIRTAEDDFVYHELHQQRAYDLHETMGLLLGAGFSSVRFRDNYGDAPPEADTERVTFIAE
ncbi:MAG: class I SAM-dependent methyltransferase [Defluviitaleaceae bacterium]|nr:class I SAM-dependent methyltransferase [Defluviitaleaceae bacterium]MCL2240250.1 class I SAM-dependent methyltransferase [Defluviitaleaceae bacterium]